MSTERQRENVWDCIRSVERKMDAVEIHHVENIFLSIVHMSEVISDMWKIILELEKRVDSLEKR